MPRIVCGDLLAIFFLMTHTILKGSRSEIESDLAAIDKKLADLKTCNEACAKWVKASANLWMHRPRAGWPPELRSAYEAIHDLALANDASQQRAD